MNKEIKASTRHYLEECKGLDDILKNKDRKQMWKTIKTLDANEQEIEEIGRTLIMIYQKFVKD